MSKGVNKKNEIKLIKYLASANIKQSNNQTSNNSK